MLAMDTTTTTLQSLKTPFGAVEDFSLLDRLPEQNVTRVDLLETLTEIWGDKITEQRDKLYLLVSGSCDDDTFREVLTEFYVTYPAFSNYVDEVYLFEDRSIPLVTRIISPARQLISDLQRTLCTNCNLYHGTMLGEHQDYMYMSFSGTYRPSCKGSVDLC